MTSARVKRGRHTGRGSGLIVFAVVLLIMLSIFNLIDGIGAVARSHVYVGNAQYVIGDLRTWGWVAIAIGALQLLAAAGIMAGNQAARWFAVVLIGLNAVSQMLFLPGYPLWSLMIIAVDVVALWGLCAYGSREHLAAE